MICCTNPNKEYIDKVKQQVKEDALGVEMNYRNIEFKWIDTLLVKEEIALMNSEYENRLKEILNIEHYVKDNFEKGNIFSKSYLTKERFTELRNWELNVGHPNEYFGLQSSWVKDGYKDYYEFAFANRNASAWISELCNQVEETDNLLNDYESLEEGNIALIENALWFYNRIDNYQSNKNPDEIWKIVSEEINQLKIINSNIDSLNSFSPDKVVYFKALNTYKINNPILNGAEQELKKYFLFDTNSNIIGTEEFQK